MLRRTSWRRLPERLGAVTVGYKMPSKLALAVRGTVAGDRLGALEEGRGGGGGTSLPFQYIPGGGRVSVGNVLCPAGRPRRVGHTSGAGSTLSLNVLVRMWPAMNTGQHSGCRGARPLRAAAATHHQHRATRSNAAGRTGKGGKSGQREGGAAYPPTAIGHPPTAINFPPTAIGHAPTDVGHPPNAVGYPPTAVRHAPATLQPPSVTLQPPLITLQPPSVTLQPPLITLQPPSVTLQPPSTTLQPPSVIHRRPPVARPTPFAAPQKGAAHNPRAPEDMPTDLRRRSSTPAATSPSAAAARGPSGGRPRPRGPGVSP